jgi:uncharacterized protein YndB with AHSA1/START domain
VAVEPVSASVYIEADPQEVYQYFVDADAMVLWMGETAVLDPQPGGAFWVDVQGTPVRGRFLELDPPNRVVFSWGFEGSEALPPEASRVEVRLTSQDGGTRVDLLHFGLSGTDAAEHASGWQRFLHHLEAIPSLSPGPAGGQPPGT